MAKLQNSNEYKKMLRDKQLGRLKKIDDDDDTVAELRDKESELFWSSSHNIFILF